ncbi:hypothetical protein FG91_03189 [Sphingopyxis sp. LC81]|nr:hypothetical protein FG91_03189 [Sphingopyxis sp. LC81]
MSSNSAFALDASRSRSMYEGRAFRRRHPYRQMFSGTLQEPIGLGNRRSWSRDRRRGVLPLPGLRHQLHRAGSGAFGRLFRTVGGIDPALDHIADDPAPQCFRHDPEKGAAVRRPSDVGPNPRKFVEVVPHNSGTIVQPEMGGNPGRDRNGECGIVIPGRYRRRDHAELAPGFIGAQDKARPCLSTILQPAFLLGAPEIDIADDVGRLRLSP